MDICQFFVCVEGFCLFVCFSFMSKVNINCFLKKHLFLLVINFLNLIYYWILVIYYASIICPLVLRNHMQNLRDFILLIISTLSKWMFSSASLISFQMAWLLLMNEKKHCTGLPEIHNTICPHTIQFRVGISWVIQKRKKVLVFMRTILRCDSWSPWRRNKGGLQ